MHNTNSFYTWRHLCNHQAGQDRTFPVEKAAPCLLQASDLLENEHLSDICYHRFVLRGKRGIRFGDLLFQEAGDLASSLENHLVTHGEDQERQELCVSVKRLEDEEMEDTRVPIDWCPGSPQRACVYM